MVDYISEEEFVELKKQLMRMTAKYGVSALMEAYTSLASDFGEGNAWGVRVSADPVWLAIAAQLSRVTPLIRNICESAPNRLSNN
jgi:hypothetical protein